MLFKQFIGLTISALLTIGNNGFVSPAITWLNNSSLNITIGSSVNYYFDLEFNEWYPASGSVDTGGTGRCDTNIIIGNGTDPMTGFIQYDRSSVTRGTNLISYDENVAVTSNMIYFYNVSSFTLTTFTSTDTGDLNQPTFTVTFTDGYIWDERDDSDLYALMNLMLGDISAIKQNETNVYNAVVSMGTQLGLVKSSIDAMAQNIVSIDSKLDNIVSYLSTINSNIIQLHTDLNNIYNNQLYDYVNVYDLHVLDAHQKLKLYFNTLVLPSNNQYNFPFDRFYGFTNPKPKSNQNMYWKNTRHSKLVFCFIANIQNAQFRLFYNNDNSITVSPSSNLYSNTASYYIYTLQYDLSNYRDGWYSFDFSNMNSNQFIIPLFIGFPENLTDDEAAIFGVDKYADTTSDLDQAQEDLESAYSQEDSLIQTVASDLDNNVPSVTTQDSVLGSQSFFNAANWVKTQFDRITITEAPILGNLLSFSLIIGLAIAFIGRRLGD